MKRSNCSKLLAVMSCVILMIFMWIVPISSHAEEVELPDTMFWSCYDVGSSGYVQASAMADAFLKKWRTRIRLVPSGTSIGRLTPLTSKKVHVGFLANEVYFAVEGLYDFSTYEWGPQDLRIVLAHPSSTGMLATKVSGIKKPEDIKGKRVSWIIGNPSLNIKAEAQLAFADLTWDDVEKVEFPSYSAALKALKQGKTDVSPGTPTAPLIYELADSRAGYQVVEFPPDNEEGWKRAQKIAPFLFPAKATRGPGISKENPAWLAHVRYPMATVYEETDAEFVYNLVKAMDEAFDLYKDSFNVMPDWDIEISGVPPADAPFHEGAIRYLKEKGVWTEEHTKWNEARIEHLEKVQRAWERAFEKGQSEELKSGEFSEYWLKERAKSIAD